jgi:molecular chaperone GrpE
MTDENINNNEDAVEPQLELVDETEKLKQELGQAKDKYIRLFADFDNMRKRHERERVSLIKYAHEEVIIEMLGFLEDFERTIAAAKASPSNAPELLKGIEMVYGRMQQLLKKYDVREIECAGKKFDPDFHEVLMVDDTADQKDGIILEVFQKGYTLGDRVVRTAKVKVSKKN